MSARLDAPAAAAPAHSGPALACYHCGLPVPAKSHWRVRIDGASQPMCCPGCEAVAQTIVELGQEDYYRTRSAFALRASSASDDSATGGGGAGRMEGMGLEIIRGLLLFVAILRKAFTTESDMIRYLPSLREDREYITTKKANSRVIKSA